MAFVADPDIYDTQTLTFTVPSGCKVVYCVISGTRPSVEAASDKYIIEFQVSNSNSGVEWVFDENIWSTSTYVGVTPGKSYSLKCEAIIGGGSIGNNNKPAAGCYIYYSTTINNTTPTVTDY